MSNNRVDDCTNASMYVKFVTLHNLKRVSWYLFKAIKRKDGKLALPRFSQPKEVPCRKPIMTKPTKPEKNPYTCWLRSVKNLLFLNKSSLFNLGTKDLAQEALTLIDAGESFEILRLFLFWWKCGKKRIFCFYCLVNIFRTCC